MSFMWTDMLSNRIIVFKIYEDMAPHPNIKGFTEPQFTKKHRNHGCPEIQTIRKAVCGNVIGFAKKVYWSKEPMNVSNGL